MFSWKKYELLSVVNLIGMIIFHFFPYRLAIFVSTAGLSLNSIHASSSSTAIHKVIRDVQAQDKTTTGFLITLFGVSIYSFVYTLNDYLMTKPTTPTPPRTQCLWVGCYSTCVCILLMLIISIDTLRGMPLGRGDVIFGYAVLVLSAFGHNVTYFELVWI